ncbi:SIS domain-containing protein [Baekduia sp. Peel2402]|uniref:SIS domain-containing protein n=1 Tax=Baekduia sp. Peel2402 TaxID=3458296 RepID=UPI00403E85BD
MSWHTEDYPELREGPPWVMEEMIAAQPALAEAILDAPSPVAAVIGREIDAALAAGQPVTVVGCGTSEHGAHAIAALIAGAAAPEQRSLVRARQALTAAVEPAGGVCVAVSHDGGTRATELAALAARKAGAKVAVVTHDPAGSVAATADHVLVTPVHDVSWCHTIGYTSALLGGAAIAGPVDAGGGSAARDVLAAAIALDAAAVAGQLADRRVVLCAGAGIDHVTARELALKIAEGARQPTIALELETVVHGQLAGHEAADGLILIAIDDGTPEAQRVARRAGHVAAAAVAIGIPVAALLSSSYDTALAPDLTPAGRLVVDAPADRLAALLAGAGALQALTLALAHARGTNPDLIRREEAAYRAAAAAAEDPSGW